MDIVEGDDHDVLTATFQSLEVARLNHILKECGLADRDLRRSICEAYFFSSGYFMDSGWFEERERRVRPNVYFESIDAGNQTSQQVFLPNPEVGTMWHEYAHGAVAWLFDDKNEDASEIITGDVHS